MIAKRTKTIKGITSLQTIRTPIIAIVALIVTFSTPVVFAGAGTVEDYWWKADPGMCYNTSSLDDMTVDGSTGNGSDVITETEKSRAAYNAEMNGITINGDSWTNCYGKHFDVASTDHADDRVLATERTYTDWLDSESITQSEIRFNTDHGWGTDSDTCSTGDVDIEWVFNHEMGHGIGLEHHTHSPANSVMHAYCNAVIANLQDVDDTAIDIHYP